LRTLVHLLFAIGDWRLAIPPSSLLWWIAETVGEAVLAFLLTRHGPLIFWALNRFVLDPLLLRPTEWSLRMMTAGYARLLGWSLRYWGVVLAFGVFLLAAAAGLRYFDLLGRDLVPSEDQSRFVIHITTPVGSSIDQVDTLLQECEKRLAERDDVEGILTTVATQPGQLMNQADIFIHLVPQNER